MKVTQLYCTSDCVINLYLMWFSLLLIRMPINDPVLFIMLIYCMKWSQKLLLVVSCTIEAGQEVDAILSN